MYKKILSDPLRFPDDMGSEAKSLLSQLLDRDPSRRLGVRGAEDIKAHPFFSKHIDFKRLWAKKIQPPYKPNVVSHINIKVVWNSEKGLEIFEDVTVRLAAGVLEGKGEGQQ